MHTTPPVGTRREPASTRRPRSQAGPTGAKARQPGATARLPGGLDAAALAEVSDLIELRYQTLHARMELEALFESEDTSR